MGPIASSHQSGSDSVVVSRARLTICTRQLKEAPEGIRYVDVSEVAQQGQQRRTGY